MRLLGGNGLLGLFARGDVQGDKRDALVQVVQIQGRRTQQHVDNAAVLAPPAGLHRAGALARDLIVFIPADPIKSLLSGVKHPRALIDQFAGGVADHSAEPFIGLHNDPVAHHADAGGHCPENAFQHFQAVFARALAGILGFAVVGAHRLFRSGIGTRRTRNKGRHIDF